MLPKLKSLGNNLKYLKDECYDQICELREVKFISSVIELRIKKAFNY